MSEHLADEVEAVPGRRRLSLNSAEAPTLASARSTAPPTTLASSRHLMPGHDGATDVIVHSGFSRFGPIFKPGPTWCRHGIRPISISSSMLLKWLAGGLGFEPRLAESESAVLPLDDPPPGRRVAAGRWARRVRLVAQAPGLG